MLRAMDEEQPQGQNDEKALESVTWKEDDSLFAEW